MQSLSACREPKRCCQALIAHFTSNLTFSPMCICRDVPPEMFTLPRVWDGVQRQVDYPARVKAVQEFNRANVWRKRGCAVTPTR